MKELKGFRRIHLAKGESTKVSFTITDEMLSFYNQQLDYVLEPGDFEIMIGPSNLKNLKKTILSITDVTNQ